jgi:hypothetical protein
MMPWQVSDQDASSARRARELKEAQQKRLEDGNDGNGAARWAWTRRKMGISIANVTNEYIVI